MESRVRPDAGFGTFAVRAPIRLQGDVLNQLRHVGGAADRLLTIQDKDPCSPSFGSFHYAYWRDKTSDFADVRFQEAGAMLGLLSLPAFDVLRESEGWPSREALMAAFSAGLANLAEEQHSEGCYDEWYKGERGFAVTAFTTVAYGLAALLLDDGLDDRDRDLLTRTLKRAAQWLSRRDDTVKINHQIAATAALASVWRLTGEERWHRAAERKIEMSWAHQSDEGWFTELGGADLGYASVALDYLMIYWRLTGDDRATSAASRLIEFLAPHLHPDLTAAAEAGICRNAYVGQIGFLLLGSHPSARAIVARMATLADSAKRIRPYLDDDLRLCRWGLLPVLAALLAGPPAQRFTLERQIEIDGEAVRITDVLRDRENALSSEMIFPELSVCGVAASLPRTTFAKASMLRVTKTIHTGEPEPQLEVELDRAMILKLVATVVILALVIYSLDLDKLSGALSAIDWHWLVLGSLASALFVSLRIIKWRELTRRNGMNASGKEIARTALLGLAVGLITPVRLGELVGVAPFPRSDRGRAILSHGYDRLYELFAVLVFSLPAAFLLLGWTGRLVSVAIVTLFGIGIVMAQSTYWRPKFGGFSLLGKVPKLQALLSAIIVTSPGYWMLSIAYFLTGYLLLTCFIVGIEPIDNWHAVLILPVVTLSNLISITIGGLGVREGLAAALSPSVGLAPEVAAAAFFLSFFSTRLIPGLIGLAWTAMSTKRHAPSTQGSAA